MHPILYPYFFLITQQGKARFVVLLTDFLLVLKLLEPHSHSRRAAEQQRFEDHMFSNNKYIGKVCCKWLSQEKQLVDVGTVIAKAIPCSPHPLTHSSPLRDHFKFDYYCPDHTYLYSSMWESHQILVDLSRLMDDASMEQLGWWQNLSSHLSVVFLCQLYVYINFENISLIYSRLLAWSLWTCCLQPFWSLQANKSKGSNVSFVSVQRIVVIKQHNV